MKQQRQVLESQLGRLEGEMELIEQAIREIQRRFQIIDEVESWNLLGQGEVTEVTMEYIPNFVLDLDEDEIDWEALKKPSFPA